jgi:hypothetical protein
MKDDNSGQVGSAYSLDVYQTFGMSQMMNNQAESWKPVIFKRDIERLAEKLFVQVADTTEPDDSYSQEEMDRYNMKRMKACFRVAEQFIKYKNSL